jgi:hypothetical protein
MLKEAIGRRIGLHESFQRLVQPIGPGHVVRDAEFYVRKDGIIFNADGYAHPTDAIVGNPLYVLDQQGDTQIFGESYRKTFFYPGTTEPIPYSDRPKLLESIDPELNQYEKNPWPLQYEQVIPRSQFIGYIPGELAFRVATADSRNIQLRRDLENFETLLDIHLDTMPTALTGGLALGSFESYHDIDVVFRGDLIKNRDIANKIKNLVLQEPSRRLHEGGKSWLIRFYNDNKTIMCCFFVYQDMEDAPVKTLAMKPLAENIHATGSVSDATHALYTPTIVYLHDSIATQINNEHVHIRLPDNLPLVIYHTGTRGELNTNDIVRVRGGFMAMTISEQEQEALVVIDREGVRNETPPWDSYYSRPALIK